MKKSKKSDTLVIKPLIKNRNYLFFTVFTAGMATLAVEFVTSRMLQTVYGTSNIVWANVIGLVLLFLTIGYFIGGKLADKNPDPKLFYTLVTLAGFSSTFFLLLTSFILKSTAITLAKLNFGSMIGSLVAVFICLSIPITLLGCISPFAIRLGVRNIEEAGRVSGRIYSISTWGSLVGTYLPVLWIIPTTGSRMAAIIFGSLLLISGLVGMWIETLRVGKAVVLPLVLLPFVYLWGTGNIKTTNHQIFETESAYNYIEVVREGNCNYLHLNEGQVIHSMYCDDADFDRLGVWSNMLTAPYFLEPAYINSKNEKPISNLLVIGLGAGTIPKEYIHTFGDIKVDGIEIDPEIVAAGKEYFSMTEPNLNIIVGDGRYELNRLSGRYDAVAIDAYKLPYIPWHLTTQEFFTEVKNHMEEQGVLSINVGRTPNDRRLVEAITATLLSVFPSVHTIDSYGLNTVLIATNQTTERENLFDNMEKINPTESRLLYSSMQKAILQFRPTIASNIIFTDARAPVETITDSIVLDFMLHNGNG